MCVMMCLFLLGGWVMVIMVLICLLWMCSEVIGIGLVIVLLYCWCLLMVCIFCLMWFLICFGLRLLG